MRLSCCFARAGVRLSLNLGFWRFNIFFALGRSARMECALYPITFHRMRNPSWIEDLQEVVDGEMLRLNLTASSVSTQVVSWDALIAQYRGPWKGKYPAKLYYLDYA